MKSGTGIHCFIHVSNLKLIFLNFFFTIIFFFWQIWSQHLKFFKLTEIWYQGILLYVYHGFNTYFCKIFVIHSFLGKFGSNLVPSSLIVNSICITTFKLLRASSRSSLHFASNTVVESVRFALLWNSKIYSIIETNKCYLYNYKIIKN